jgi:outer membrane protein insertion porin family
MWRQVTGLSERASASVRNDAGDSVKSSVTHTYLADRLDNPLLPTRGYLVKTISELAGWGPLKGDVAFLKSEFVSSGAVPIPILVFEEAFSCR